MTPTETLAKLFAGSESLVSPNAYCSEQPPFVRDWHVYLNDRATALGVSLKVSSIIFRQSNCGNN
jgi:hypothetical protein